MKVRVGDGGVAFDVEGAWLVPMGAWMVERPTVIVIGDPRAARLLGSSLAEVAQVIYLEDREADLAGLCEALEIRRPIVIVLGAEDESVDGLRTGFPVLVLAVDDPDGAGVARRLVQASQPGD